MSLKARRVIVAVQLNAPFLGTVFDVEENAPVDAVAPADVLAKPFTVGEDVQATEMAAPLMAVPLVKVVCTCAMQFLFLTLRLIVGLMKGRGPGEGEGLR